ncbi:hypothetical protein BMS3Bbin02_00293 [bacterium BMS3Bbin02]|nr:hypothetical protein BMS3Bbin02_00293 [bacterium BMS3Bbin02]
MAEAPAGSTIEAPMVLKRTAVNAPVSMMPSSAMLMTPPRSEKMPPIAARVSGVADLIIAAIVAVERIAPTISIVTLPSLLRLPLCVS